jgi:hypothetical protein
MRNCLLIAVAVLAAGSARAEVPQERLKWDELASRITDAKVEFVLPDGTHLKGKVMGVSPDGLSMNISKTSNRNVQRKGKHLVPRQSITMLRVTEYRKLGRLIGTLGAVALAGGIVAAQQIDVYEGPALIIVPVAIAGGLAGSAVGGYYVGKRIDKRVTDIIIVP